MKGIARQVIPGLRCYAVPQGLREMKGEEGVVDHLISQIPKIIDGDLGLA